MRILIIGCGGIGSYLCSFISKAMLYGQLDGAEITVADGDCVEPKNLPYQNFSEDDLLLNKAQVLGERYALGYIPRKIKEQDLKGYDVIVLCVDNNEIRRAVYNYCKDKDVFWIDARAEDKSVAVFTKSKNNGVDEMSRFTKEGVKDRSCQTNEAISKKRYNYGNIIAGAIAFQMLLSYVRGEKVQDRVIVSV